tara:strand:+ start:1089 stop:1394 length:306 start_codon:yes stop_codon:yes gene_type:complete
MKRGIFNNYVKQLCKEIGISEKELFKKNRAGKVSSARFILYSMCYQRPMNILQIVDLMSERGYTTSRQTIEYGIEKVNTNPDPDIQEFINNTIGLYNHNEL